LLFCRHRFGIERPRRLIEPYCPPPNELDTNVPNLKHLGGSKSDDWNLMLCNQAISSGWFRENMAASERQERQTAILAFLAGVNPQDVTEGMMAAQLYASHALAMECYRRAMLPGQSVEGKQINLTLAAKLTKANAAQVEALKKYRGKEAAVTRTVSTTFPSPSAALGGFEWISKVA
jgi:hypothetical protein